MTSVDVNFEKTHFEGPDGTTQPMVKVLPPSALPLGSKEAGVYVTFHLA
jgi:hypothetical protein